jgi:hypothetical protein
MNMAGVLIISSRRLTSTEFDAQWIRTTVNVLNMCDEKGLFFFFLLTARRPTRHFLIMTKGITLSQQFFFLYHHQLYTNETGYILYAPLLVTNNTWSLHTLLASTVMWNKNWLKKIDAVAPCMEPQPEQNKNVAVIPCMVSQHDILTT